MVLKLYNTLTRTEEEFKPLHANQVTMYSCGPTVYDYAHIGNWRQMTTNDLLRRTLEFNDYKVKHVMNITDVDDKTINGSQKAGLALSEFTKKYEMIFLKDLASLNILPPTTLTHATEFIPQMIELVQKLIDSGYAYKTSDGIYFQVASFPAYGNLSKQPIKQSEGHDDESHDKRDARDFALWKFQTPADGEVGWEASFGKGRPGWHIECSAMSLNTLGETLDIHTGATDLIFPHHENEIAQSESTTGKTFVNLWLHGGFLQVDGQKMSKSLNNFYTLKDLTEHNISPLAYRLWLLMAHYRSPINFTWEALTAAQTTLHRLEDKIRDLPDDDEMDQNLREQFLALINNDLNLPQALAFALSSEANKATWLEFDKVLGLDLAKIMPLEIPQELQNQLEQREEARNNKDWTGADEIRKAIEEKGFLIDDTDTGPRLRLKN
jgi:cysteinyl-tRNA synthetase